MRVVFLGNHTVGVTALGALLDAGATVSGVVAHPPDPEDGVRYDSVHDHARARGLDVIRGEGRAESVRAFVTEARPELLWITDYRYVLPASLLDTAPAGAVNLHPSLLPRYRGRAPINWAIIHGECRLGLTAHFVDEGMDTGDIIEQHAFELGPEEDVGVALDRLMPLYASTTRSVFDAFRRGTVPRRPQDHAAATSFPRRRPEDGCIDWAQPAVRVKDFVRALARPYPGAFSDLGGARLRVWRARVAEKAPLARDCLPGTILSAGCGELLVSASEGCVLVSEYAWEGTPDPVPAPGARFVDA